jgi:ornithine cyclodeaminase/alanine dehydrogenase-like protein (mu-crystallin family)
VILGSGLGATRTGAIGGVAAKWMAPVGARRLAILGGGVQSRTQLRALRVVRPTLTEVRVFRRDRARREETARQWSTESGLDVQPADSAREAVDGAEIVVLATDSATPVVETDWLRDGAHVTSLGPKYHGRSEVGLDLLETADWLVSDFPEQYAREPEFLLHGTPRESQIRDLAALVGERPVRDPGLRTVFLSHGLAGTEVAVAHRSLSSAARLGVGQEIHLEGS